MTKTVNNFKTALSTECEKNKLCDELEGLGSM